MRALRGRLRAAETRGTAQGRGGPLGCFEPRGRLKGPIFNTKHVQKRTFLDTFGVIFFLKFFEVKIMDMVHLKQLRVHYGLINSPIASNSEL